ncbi:pilin major subunit VirB2 (plasmid) [Rhizobium rhizogenes]|uniref:pilin major subunit VirB2 n=1 Tax=Rhizobium rhizogenes TaxID=359 RepID=UPI001573CA74|nr:pilin major subunit VirB2 [Rhizobium rhizogenes]NTI26874.1 pilin major subunit VirB2 [Rhizobium rhizogenes]QTG10333.1 pilin major subunit VirB2 [Rhizobium rhizogenes]
MACFEKYRVRSTFRCLRELVVRLAVTYLPSLSGAIGWSLLFSEPAAAQAAGGTDPATMVNNICTFILGPFGQSLAVLGIVAIGISWMFGRASLGLVAGVVGGIVIMFGASFLGQTLTGGGG